MTAFPLLLAGDPGMALATATCADERRRFGQRGSRRAKIGCECKHLVGAIVLIKLERGPAQEPCRLTISGRISRAQNSPRQRFQSMARDISTASCGCPISSRSRAVNLMAPSVVFTARRQSVITTIEPVEKFILFASVVCIPRDAQHKKTQRSTVANQTQQLTPACRLMKR